MIVGSITCDGREVGVIDVSLDGTGSAAAYTASPVSHALGGEGDMAGPGALAQPGHDYSSTPSPHAQHPRHTPLHPHFGNHPHAHEAQEHNAKRHGVHRADGSGHGGQPHKPGVTPHQMHRDSVAKATADPDKAKHMDSAEKAARDPGEAGHEVSDAIADPSKAKPMDDSEKTARDPNAAAQAAPKGTIDRSRFADELKGKPELRNKIMRIAANEQGDHPQGTQAVLESMMNRAEVRGTSLEAQAKWHESEGGYYQQGNMGRGALENPQHRAILERALSETLAGSNIANYATDNSSGDLARREIASGRFLFRKSYGGETFSVPNTHEQPQNARRWVEWMRNNGSQNTPTTGTVQPGVVRPGADIAPTAIPAATGNPAAFIMHHTGGGGGVEGVQETLRQRGLGVEYIMDREGNVHRAGGPGSQHMLTGWGKGEGLSNKNVVGMEVIARDNKDVTQKQIDAAQKFIRENYPNTPVYGHGEVNPGHKEADEGMAITNAIREERSHRDDKN